MNLSDIVGGSFPLIAGPNGVNLNDLVEMGPDGKAYSVAISNCSAVANPGQVVAETTVIAGAAAIGGGQTPIVQNSSDGSVVTLAPYSGSNGAALYSYSASGALLHIVSLATTAAALNLQALSKLSNGNLCAVWQLASGSLSFAVYTTALLQVVAPTAIEAATAPTGANISALSLSGGGFALAWLKASGHPRIAVYSNAGAAVLAPTDVTASGTGSFTFTLTQLSSGNILYAFWQSTAGQGMQFAIYSNAGAVVAAVTAGAGSTGAANPIYASALTGFFSIAFANSSNYLTINIYNNAGVQQGSSYTPQTSAMQPGNVLANDGASFWLFSMAGSSGNWLANLLTTGAVNLANVKINASDYTGIIATGFIQNGFFAITIGPSTPNPFNALFTINLSYPAAVVAPVLFGQGRAGPSTNPNMIPSGNFSFIAAYDDNPGGPTHTFFYVGKFASTAIQGVAVTGPAAAGARVSVQPNRIGGGAAAYGVNHMGGTNAVAFNHNSAQALNLIGNKGVMTQNGVVLMGVA